VLEPFLDKGWNRFVVWGLTSVSPGKASGQFKGEALPLLRASIEYLVQRFQKVHSFICLTASLPVVLHTFSSRRM